MTYLKQEEEELQNSKALITSPRVPLKVDILIALNVRFVDAFRRSPTQGRLLASMKRKTPANPNPSSTGISSHDIVFDPTRNLWARIYIPSSPPARPAGHPVLLFCHGGWFCLYSPTSSHYNNLCNLYAGELPAIVISVAYRLAPEHRCPVQYLDCLDVLRFLDSPNLHPQLEPLLRNADLRSCFVMGDSSGGNIAHHVARMWAAGHAARAKCVRVCGVVAVQPAFGGKARVGSETREMESPMVSMERVDWMWRTALPEGEDCDHWASNVFGPREAEAGPLGELFPAVMVVYGWFDRFVDRQKGYVHGLRERGKEVVVVEYPAMFHAFYVFHEVPEYHMLVKEVRAFVDRFSSADHKVELRG